MEEVLKLAIEGGYKQFNAPRKNYIEIDRALLDPLFWQALGKSLGWKKKCSIKYEEGGVYLEKEAREYISKTVNMDMWQYQMHRFIDHLASGKDADSFFSALISTKE